MDAPGRIEVHVDVSRNQLKLAFGGHVDEAVMRRYETEITRALNSLRPGFSLLSDLTGLEAMDLSCVAPMERTMDAMRGSGVGLIVRIIPNPRKDIGLNIMSLFHYPRSVQIVTVQTRDEANATLENPA